MAFVNEAAESYARVPSIEVTPLGQINRTYLVAQVGEDLTVIDQHTAHERVLFERLQRAWTRHKIESQALLIPDPVDVSPAQAALLQRYQGDLEQLGLEIEPFGTSTVLIRSTPVGLGRIDAGRFLQDLFEDLAQWDSLADLEAKVRSVLASMACHGAVRAGRHMRLPKKLKCWWRNGEAKERLPPVLMGAGLRSDSRSVSLRNCLGGSVGSEPILSARPT